VQVPATLVVTREAESSSSIAKGVTIMIEEARPNTPLYILRSMADLTGRIAARHANRGAQVTVPGQRAQDASARFAQSYDEVLRLDTSNNALKVASDRESRALAASAADWAVVFAYDITGTEPEDWKPTRTTADEVIRAATQMRADIATAHAANPIDGADAALQDLDTAIDRARTALAALKDGLALEQETRNTTRELAREYSTKLIAFRRALGRVIGTRHRDHRALLLTRKTPVTSDELEGGTGQSGESGQSGEFALVAAASNPTDTVPPVSSADGEDDPELVAQLSQVG